MTATTSAGTRPQHKRSAQRSAQRRITQAALITVPVVVLVIMGWTHRWMSDDAYIDLRIVRNVIEGHGPVFNVGERVEAFTNPLWVAILAIIGGTLRFLPLAWWAVLIGLSLTAFGMVLGGIAAVRLGRRHSISVIAPVGVAVIAVTDSMWTFSTSGLETGLSFGWIAMSWWLLVRRLETGNRTLLAAVIFGVGPIIRPDLALFSGCFLVGLLLLVGAERSKGGRSRWRAFGPPLACFVVVPGIYEIFRMAYFAMMVPNTALAKSAFALWPEQGLSYLGDFLGPNWLWIPLGVLGVTMALRYRSWWKGGSRRDVVIGLVPAVGGALSATYVTAIGGDFMHARMVLPAFFAISLTLTLDLGNRLERTIPLVITGIWMGVAGFILRYDVAFIGPNHIANERAVYIRLSGNPHPVSPTDIANSPWSRYGRRLAALAARTPKGSQVLAVIPPKGSGDRQSVNTPLTLISARSRLPERLFVSAGNIGEIGWSAGDDVYIFDLASLADPIGSHTITEPHGRPGHNHRLGQEWLIADVAAPGHDDRRGPRSQAQIRDARAAMRCDPLRSYLAAIDAPLTTRGLAGNLIHAFEWTWFRFPPTPAAARASLCS
ncbi:MAG: hypothetical protein WCI12_03405 [Actinomycetes bacterium]